MPQEIFFAARSHYVALHIPGVPLSIETVQIALNTGSVKIALKEFKT